MLQFCCCFLCCFGFHYCIQIEKLLKNKSPKNHFVPTMAIQSAPVGTRLTQEPTEQKQLHSKLSFCPVICLPFVQVPFKSVSQGLTRRTYSQALGSVNERENSCKWVDSLHLQNKMQVRNKQNFVWDSVHTTPEEGFSLKKHQMFSVNITPQQSLAIFDLCLTRKRNSSGFIIILVCAFTVDLLNTNRATQTKPKKVKTTRRLIDFLVCGISIFCCRNC